MVSLATKILSVEGLAIWAGYGPRVFTVLTKHILFLCNCKGLCVIIYLDDILVLPSIRQDSSFFSWSLLVHFGLHINFPSLTSISLIFLFWACVGM